VLVTLSLAVGCVGGIYGIGGGARLQRIMPEVVIRRLVGALVVATGILYLWSGLDR
jgi:uncharacterized membrane protein YfcA